MKKRIWSLVLCLVLVCAGFAGCGSEEDDGTAEILSGRLVKSKLQEFVDGIWNTVSRVDDYVPTVGNVGYDFTAEFGYGELSEEEGEEKQNEKSARTKDMDVIGLKGSVDSKEDGSGRLSASMSWNEEDIAAVNAIVAGDAIYVNLPAYTKDYTEIPLEDYLGKAMDTWEKILEKILETRIFISVWGNFSSEKFADAFEYQGKEEKQSIGIGDYKITGDKYIARAKTEDVNAAFDIAIGEMRGKPEFEVVEEIPFFSEGDTIDANYYTAKNGEYAWEFKWVIKDTTFSLVFISAEKGFYLYSVGEEGREQPLVFSRKESAQKGKVTVLVGEKFEEKFEIAYDNYTKNSLDISMEIYGIPLQIKSQSIGKKSSFAFDIRDESEGDSVGLACKLENAQDYFDLTISLTQKEVEVVTLKMNWQMRDFVPYDIPNIVNPEDWEASLDQEKLEEDVNRLITLFPFLWDMLGTP